MLPTPHLPHILASGFPHPDTIHHLFIGGSELHGAKVGATDDLDLYGIFLDPPAITLGLDPRTHFVWSTAADDRRNGPDDVDLTLYSLHRWAQLAAKGNATALHFLFADATAVSSPLWRRVQQHRELFLSRNSAEQFLGFADNQLRRIAGELGPGKHGTRPEYTGTHGYDTKAAMHCLRLYLECIELMRDGTITLPRPERDYLIDCRQGTWTTPQFLAEAARLRLDAEQSALTSPLPERVDRQAISALVAEVTLEAWKSQSGS